MHACCTHIPVATMSAAGPVTSRLNWHVNSVPLDVLSARISTRNALMVLPFMVFACPFTNIFFCLDSALVDTPKYCVIFIQSFNMELCRHITRTKKNLHWCLEKQPWK